MDRMSRLAAARASGGEIVNATDHRRAMQLFQEAVEQDASARGDFLTDACDGDPALRAEVESLLANHDTKTLIADRTAPPPGQQAPWKVSARATRRRLTPRLWRQADPGWRRIGLLLLAFPALTLAAEYWLSARIEGVLRCNLENQLRATLASNAAAVTNWLELEKLQAREWADHPHVREHFAALASRAAAPDATLATLRDSSHYQALLATITPLHQRAGVASVNATDADGLVVFASRNVLQGRHQVSDHGAAQIAAVYRGETVLLPPLRSKSLVKDAPPDAPDRPVILIGAPIRDHRDQIVGALFVCHESGQEFTRLLDLGRAGPRADAYAFGPDGRLLSASGFEQQLPRLGLIDRPDPGASVLNVELRDPGVDLSQAPAARPAAGRSELPLTRMAAAATARRDGIDVDGYRDYRGVRVVGAWDWLDDYGFGVAAEIDYDAAFAPIQQVRRSLWILSGLLTALGTVALAASLSAARLRRQVGEARNLGQYTLEEKIGSGGMGDVYKARHALLRRPTAVKVLNGDDADPAAVARFEREVQIASSLTHPNTVEIYDYGRTEDGVFYFAMEYLPGLDLEKLVALDGPLPPARVLHILAQVLGSLAEAHDLGMVHRDVKPANIILGQRGGVPDFVKLVDFGIAKEPTAGAGADVSSSGLISGTPLYMAPECLADPSRASPQSDLYALGVVAFYLLSGQRLFAGKSPLDILNRVMNEPPRLASEATAADIPRELDDLVHACVSKNPDERPASAHDMLAVVHALAAKHPWSQASANRWWAQLHARLAAQSQPLDQSSPGAIAT